ncbi:hypothetical protein PRK78_000496 [Emydomyces testavorans]|uniref:Uncharacterized protein n=1 Tax=Emydomyces testavorans TaxID=2070801 RepID=A0AAF0DBC6_9EURO|nr:hypothetical protein PRK78_000496 [Emydomyces testavorans]
MHLNFKNAPHTPPARQPAPSPPSSSQCLPLHTVVKKQQPNQAGGGERKKTCDGNTSDGEQDLLHELFSEDNNDNSADLNFLNTKISSGLDRACPSKDNKTTGNCSLHSHLGNGCDAPDNILILLDNDGASLPSQQFPSPDDSTGETVQCSCDDEQPNSPAHHAVKRESQSDDSNRDTVPSHTHLPTHKHKHPPLPGINTVDLTETTPKSLRPPKQQMVSQPAPAQQYCTSASQKDQGSPVWEYKCLIGYKMINGIPMVHMAWHSTLEAADDFSTKKVEKAKHQQQRQQKQDHKKMMRRKVGRLRKAGIGQ